MAAATISVCSTRAFCFNKTTTALARSLITHSKMAEAEAKPVAPNADVLEWPKIDNRRLLHAVYRVGDLDRSIKFYTETLGMKLLRKKDIPEEKYSNAFLGFGPEESQFVLKLTYNYGVSSYNIGTGFGHFAVATPDAEKLMEDAVAKGANVLEFLGDMLDGRRVIGFVEDPDGYTFEIFHTEQPSTPQPLSQVMLRVGDFERSIKFYENALGLKLLWKIAERDPKFGVAIMGYAEANQTTIFELMYNDGENTKGNAYAHVAISTDDVYKSAEAVNLVTQELGGKITRQPGPIPGLNTKITSFLDPDGWKIVLVDNEDFLKELQQ